MKTRRALNGLVLTAVLWTAGAEPAWPQDHHADAAADRPREDPAEDDTLAALVSEALERNPQVVAAARGAEAAEAGVPPAGAWEDPVLTVGFTNLRTSFAFGADPMTMKVIQLGQAIPLPGQLAHRRAAAEGRVVSAEHRVDEVRLQVATEVKEAYSELYYMERALEVIDRNLSLLSGLEDVTAVRYGAGTEGQAAVFRAGLEADGLAAQRLEVAERRRAVLARLNALRDRPAETPVEATSLPGHLLALAARPSRRAFASALEVGGAPDPMPAAGGTRLSELPSLDSLVAGALERRPGLRVHVAKIQAQESRVRLARAGRWPSPRFAVGYGQRDGHPDFLNATLSVELPIFAGRKQTAAVREEAAALARKRAGHDWMVAEIEAEVREAYARVRDAVGQLAVLRQGLLARAEANLDAALAGYRAGREDFLALLDGQATLYRYELERHRRLADLLAAWASLERAVGEEIEP